MAAPPETTPNEKVIHPDPDPTPILTIAPNITVRPYQSRDAPPTAKHGNNSIIAGRMRNTFVYPYTLEVAENWINKCKDPAEYVKPGPFDPETSDGTLPAIPTRYAICVDDEAIGGIGINFRTDVECRNGEVGYWIGEEYWGQGIMSKLAPAFVDWVWKTFDRLVRIDSGAFEGNPASCKVLMKCGMKSNGTWEKFIWKNGKLINMDVFYMLREGL